MKLSRTLVGLLSSSRSSKWQPLWPPPALHCPSLSIEAAAKPASRRVTRAARAQPRGDEASPRPARPAEKVGDGGLPVQVTLKEHILSALERCSHLRHRQQLQAHLAILGHAHTQFFSFKLLRFCTLVLADLYARALFDAIPSPNVYLYTAMITAYSSQPDPASALRLFTHMLRQGRPCPNHFIYPHVLRSCSDASDLGAVGSVHARVAKTGFYGHGVVQTALLDAYAMCSEVETARRLFDALSERNVVSCIAMITGYVRVGMIGNAMCLFEEMPERDVPSWNSIIVGCTQNGLFTEAIALFQRMFVVTGVRPNETTVVCVLSACGHLG